MKLSREHGVNPSVEQCFVCMRDVGVVLFGQLPGDKEAPRRVCLGPDAPPCAECQEPQSKGVILISCDEEKTTDPKNPWRTGGWCVVRDDYIKRVVQSKDVAAEILKHRVAFLPDDVWDTLGLPRGEVPIDVV